MHPLYGTRQVRHTVPELHVAPYAHSLCPACLSTPICTFCIHATAPPTAQYIHTCYICHTLSLPNPRTPCFAPNPLCCWSLHHLPLDSVAPSPLPLNPHLCPNSPAPVSASAHFSLSPIAQSSLGPFLLLNPGCGLLSGSFRVLWDFFFTGTSYMPHSLLALPAHNLAPILLRSCSYTLAPASAHTHSTLSSPLPSCLCPRTSSPRATAAFNELSRRGAGISDKNGLFKGYDGKITLGVLPSAQFSSGHVFFVQVSRHMILSDPHFPSTYLSPERFGGKS